MIISIWGFMGSGKSTLGQYMATHYNWLHLDSDQEIEKQENRTIAEIFIQSGERYFRELETAYLKELVRKKDTYEANLLLTTGGGMPVNEENRTLLKDLGISVFLDVPFSEIARRLERAKERPLWDHTRLAAMEDRYKKRLPIYAEADYTIHTQGKSLAEIAQEIHKLSA